MLGKEGGISKVAKNYRGYLKFIVLASALPFIYGCGGGGVGSLISFLFGSGGLGSIGDIALIGSGGGGIIGSGAASLINPEPASMLLVGSGIMAMAYFKSKTKLRRKNR